MEGIQSFQRTSEKNMSSTQNSKFDVYTEAALYHFFLNQTEAVNLLEESTNTLVDDIIYLKTLLNFGYRSEETTLTKEVLIQRIIGFYDNEDKALEAFLEHCDGYVMDPETYMNSFKQI
jgi:hypothetical protein